MKDILHSSMTTNIFENTLGQLPEVGVNRERRGGAEDVLG